MNKRGLQGALGLAAIAGLALPMTASAVINIQASAVPFIDISGTGTAVTGIGDDSETSVNPGWVGNGLLAGNVNIRIGNNGSVLWGNSAGDTFTGATEVGYINSTTFGTMAASNLSTTGNGGSGPRQMLAVLWDDNFPGTGASIRYQVIGSDLVIQWTNEDHFNAQGNGTVTYEMIAHGGVAIGAGSLVDFVYRDTLYAPQQYQNDGGSATIGYKNWGVNANANDVEYGTGGGNDSISDPAFGGANMQPKVSGSVESNDPTLTHSVSIVPAPGAMALLGLGGLVALRRRR